MTRSSNRVVPNAIKDYNLNPASRVVDKELRYTPQLKESTRLSQTAQSLADLANGVTSINSQLARETSNTASVAYAKTKNKEQWAQVSKNIDGMAKFNPYNKEVYKTLRANTIVSNGNLKYEELLKSCKDLTPDDFEAQVQLIQDEVLNNIKQENLNANQTQDALDSFQKAQGNLRNIYVDKMAQKDYEATQNQLIKSQAIDFSTSTSKKDYLEGFLDSVKKFEQTTNDLGMDENKQFELFTKALNQYAEDNVDDIDFEDFISAINQTKINGKPLTDFDFNYADLAKNSLLKTKRVKFENDNLNLQNEKLKSQKEALDADVEIFKLMAQESTSDDEIENAIDDLVQEERTTKFLQTLTNNKNALLSLRKSVTDLKTNNELRQKYISGALVQDDIINAFQDKKLSASDACAFLNNLQLKTRESFFEQLEPLKKLYLDKNSTINLGKTNKDNLTKAVYETISNPDFTKTQKIQALNRIKNVANYIDEKNQSDILKKKAQKAKETKTQPINEMRKYLANLGASKF